MRLNEISAFIGEETLPKNSYRGTDWNSVIDITQERVLKELLGVRVYTEFMADIDANGGVPSKSKYLHLLNGTTYDTFELNDLTGLYVQAETPSLKKMLRLFIYAEIKSRISDQVNSGGAYEPAAENATIQDRQQRNVTVRRVYNRAIEMRNQVIDFLLNFKDQYDTASSVSEVAGTYVITFDTAPTYLYVGDKIYGENGTEYTVTNIAGAVVTATAILGQTNETFTWYPFGDVVTSDLYLMNIFN